jgi:hypothetical protein
MAVRCQRASRTIARQRASEIVPVPLPAFGMPRAIALIARQASLGLFLDEDQSPTPVACSEKGPTRCAQESRQRNLYTLRPQRFGAVHREIKKERRSWP